LDDVTNNIYQAPLHGPLERAAADSALALWALAWQPSNRAIAIGVVTEPLMVLYREGGEAAGDDAGAVLSVGTKYIAHRCSPRHPLRLARSITKCTGAGHVILLIVFGMVVRLGRTTPGPCCR